MQMQKHHTIINMHLVETSDIILDVFLSVGDSALAFAIFELDTPPQDLLFFAKYSFFYKYLAILYSKNEIK